jgi:hypothetical protein
MTRFSNNFIYDYIQNDTLARVNTEINNQPSFMYDYNEVQELYGEGLINDVYIVGVTTLRKTDMLRLMVKNLLEGGVDERNILYIDFAMPFIRNMGIKKIVAQFVKSMTKGKPFYVVINEATLCEDWAKDFKEIKAKFPFVNFLCSSSISPMIHEYFYDNPDENSKIIILSEKNESNTKHEQDLFGVFDEFKYNIKHDVCEIKGLTKKGKFRNCHVVPELIEGYPVKVIASGAFHNRLEINEIVLPSSIEFIGDYAFTYCKNLQNIALPENLRYIGDCAFLGATALKTISGGNNVIHIGNSALYGTKWLADNTGEFVTFGKVLYKYNGQKNEVSIPSEVSSIGFFAFSNAAVRKVNLDGISTVAEGAFYSCKQLSELTNYNLETVSAFQFYNCTSLREFPFTVSSAGKFAFSGCVMLEKIKVEANQISDFAFDGCVSLLNFLADVKLTVVGICAFYNVPLPVVDFSKVENVGAFAFYNSKLRNITLDSVNDINDYAFSDSRMLAKVNINPSAKIGKSIFSNCTKIKSATLGGQYRLNAYFGGESPIRKLRVIGDCTDNLCRGNKKLQEVDIQSGTVENWAFYACSSLKKVKLSVKILGAWCFAYCDSLNKITLPSNCEYISMNAFRYCHNLADIKIKTNKPLLFGANAFYSTAENKRFYVHDKVTYFDIPIWKEYVDNMIDC